MKILFYLAAALVVPCHRTDAVTSIPTTGGGALSALKALDYRYFVAGGTCAAISHGITTPIDVVKTKIQADPSKYKKGMRRAAVDIVKTDGPGALLGGLGPTVVGYGAEGAMKFGVYEMMKPIFTTLLGEESKPLAYLLASVVAGAVAALMLCPMESTRIKIVTDPEYAHKNMITALAKLAATDGLGSTFSGLWAMLAKQIPYTFGKQVSFDVFAGFLYSVFYALQNQQLPGLTEKNVKLTVSIFAAAGASLIACILSQPGDMILTETYRPKGQGGVKISTNFRSVVARLYEQGGVPKFFTGTHARILHVGLIITSQLVIYDMVKQLLGLPATGSH